MCLFEGRCVTKFHILFHRCRPSFNPLGVYRVWVASSDALVILFFGFQWCSYSDEAYITWRANYNVWNADKQFYLVFIISRGLIGCPVDNNLYDWRPLVYQALLCDTSLSCDTRDTLCVYLLVTWWCDVWSRDRAQCPPIKGEYCYAKARIGSLAM
jgi:hypothetical protein